MAMSDLLTGPEGAHGGAGRPRLDRATHSVGRWLVTEWEGCGEWTIVGTDPPDPDQDREYVAPGEGADPERAAAESARRARAMVRRYCAAHQLDRLGTLTFAQEPDLDEAWRLVERFRKALAAELDRRIPLVVVPEYGERNGRLHFHVAFGRYLPKALLQRLWVHGFVDVRRIKRKKGEGRRAGCRRVASYIAGYLTKSGPQAIGRKRYSTTRGMAPLPRSVRRADLHEAFALVLAKCEGSPAIWSSPTGEAWDGPPVHVVLDG